MKHNPSTKVSKCKMVKNFPGRGCRVLEKMFTRKVLKLLVFFFCIALLDTTDSVKAALQTCGCRFKSLMSRPEVTVASKISLRRHEETLR